MLLLSVYRTEQKIRAYQSYEEAETEQWLAVSSDNNYLYVAISELLIASQLLMEVMELRCNEHFMDGHLNLIIYYITIFLGP